eukprot:TRINITY_DN7129_c0_g1_i1.p1 TRINITY_DN7129_c0_g1~~TRINITY_DN7129_c0_g1_i1.p1  ORF type:complete len:387 (+),score=97.16 TRINITY_DN7129_c0_g1_i1:42-1202(+)
MESLPSELVGYIAQFLSLLEVLALERTSRGLRRAVRQCAPLWEAVLDANAVHTQGRDALMEWVQGVVPSTAQGDGRSEPLARVGVRLLHLYRPAWNVELESVGRECVTVFVEKDDEWLHGPGGWVRPTRSAPVAPPPSYLMPWLFVCTAGERGLVSMEVRPVLSRDAILAACGAQREEEETLAGASTVVARGEAVETRGSVAHNLEATMIALRHHGTGHPLRHTLPLSRLPPKRLLSMHLVTPGANPKVHPQTKRCAVAVHDAGRGPRLCMWCGKVNQHYVLAGGGGTLGRWETDPDGRSGMCYGAQRLNEARKWYGSGAVAVRDMEGDDAYETICFRAAGNQGEYWSTRKTLEVVFECGSEPRMGDVPLGGSLAVERAATPSSSG